MVTSVSNPNLPPYKNTHATTTFFLQLALVVQVSLLTPLYPLINTMQVFSLSPLFALFHSQFVILIPLLFCSLLLLLPFLQWRQPRHKRLPPGSMGWPYIGETLKLYTENPNSFFSNRQKRYTKSHIGPPDSHFYVDPFVHS